MTYSSAYAQLGRVFGLLLALKQIADALGLGTALGHSGLAKLA
jgi:predicted O-methyltransferase YrrM